LLIEELSIDLPVPPCRVWEFCTEPQYRIQWISGIENITTEGTDHGRSGIGTVQYCDHGGGTVVPVTVTDWRPFDYISHQIETPLGLKVDQTIKMQPIGNCTRMIIRCAKPSIDGLIARWKSRGKIDILTGLFPGLYAEADNKLNRLARADTDTESA
jgi:hypothetical protein